MIELKNIYKTYNTGKPNEFTALKNINLKIQKGELSILKGPSGSGKSSILSLIAALSKPTSGEVIIEEARVSKLPDDFASIFRRERIGFVFQKFNLIPSLNVNENIILPLLPSALPKEIINQRAQKAMEKLFIGHKKDELAKNLSGGEQQRVAIARAIVNNPRIILADEPTANLDQKLSLAFMEYVKQLREEGKTIIIATHDPIFFDLDFTDKIIEIKNGEIL